MGDTQFKFALLREITHWPGDNNWFRALALEFDPKGLNPSSAIYCSYLTSLCLNILIYKTGRVIMMVFESWDFQVLTEKHEKYLELNV